MAGPPAIAAAASSGGAAGASSSSPGPRSVGASSTALPAQAPGAKTRSDDATAEVTPLMPGKVAEGSQVLSRLGLGPFLSSLEKHFGFEFLVMLFASQHVMKGFGMSFTQPCQRYLFSSYKVPGPQMQVYGSVVMLPWAMKPVIGLVSDLFPIGGYHKLPYMFLATILGLCACATIGLVQMEHLSILHLVVCLFFVHLMFSVTDLLTEAKYAEKLRAIPEHGPSLVTYVWFGLNLGGLFAVASVGVVIANAGAKIPFLIAVAPMSFIFVPLLRNYMGDQPRDPEELAKFRETLAEQKEVCLLCFMMFLGTMSMTFAGLYFDSRETNAAVAIVVALVMLVSFSLVLRPMIAKVNAFFLLQSSLGLSIEGASFYFYTDSRLAYPEGPHFSQEFYVSVLGIGSTLCSLLGIWTYQRYATTWTYRQLLLVTNVAVALLSLLDVVMFTRTNVKLGIPDHFFVLGSSVFTMVISQWQWMPGIVITAQLCPDGMEATMYALLAGCHNLGWAIAANCGALLLEVLDCAPKGSLLESQQFENLWIASLVSTVLPSLVLVLLPILIPDAKQTDKLLADDDRDASEGSVFRRWMGR
mmetsp:Transcript_121840/g.389616  ORF Transcript_121840/g.389616 Transcript_121840/m.389616 type:complete len:585 (+) Transcript_121840:134-1888(+)